MISLKNLVKKYKSNTIIDNVDIVFDSQINFLYGENGAGKSTLIKILASIVKPSSGTITINNEKVKFTNGTYKKNIGFCINYPTYPAHLKLSEYIETLNYIYKVDVTSLKEYQKELIHFFELNDYLNHKISDLSTGYEKRVKLLASMLHNPNIFIWDEPFANLDSVFIPKLIEKINELSLLKKYFLISSHITENFELKLKEFKEFKLENGKII